MLTYTAHFRGGNPGPATAFYLVGPFEDDQAANKWACHPDNNPDRDTRWIVFQVPNESFVKGPPLCARFDRTGGGASLVGLDYDGPTEPGLYGVRRVKAGPLFMGPFPDIDTLARWAERLPTANPWWQAITMTGAMLEQPVQVYSPVDGGIVAGVSA